MKKRVRLFLPLLLAFSLSLCPLFSCNTDPAYPPVESTEEEATVMATLSVGGKTYELRYELYRALVKAMQPGDDVSDEALADAVIHRATTLFSVFALCDELGIDLYGDEVNKTVEDYIRISVEGGSIEQTVIEGAGSYEAYLASLREIGVNYAVQDLLFRYTAGLELIREHYGKNEDGVYTGALDMSDEALSAFYAGDDCVHVIGAVLSVRIFTEQRAAEMRHAIASLSDRDAVIRYIIGHTTAGGSDVQNGMIIGRHSLDSLYYEELTKEAFSLNIGETGRVIQVATDYEDNYYILYRTEKESDPLPGLRDLIASAYLENHIGEKLSGLSEKLAGSCSRTADFDAFASRRS